jgi:transposase
MSKALSLDLRVRTLAAVAAGASHREAAERFGVSAASVSRWRNLERQQGDARPKALGGDRRSGRIEAHKETILSVLKATPDLAIEELRRRLAEKGLVRRGNDPPFPRPARDHAQKKTAHASEQERPDVVKRRQDWADNQLALDPGRSSSSMRLGPLPTWPAVMAAVRVVSV